MRFSTVISGVPIGVFSDNTDWLTEAVKSGLACARKTLDALTCGILADDLEAAGFYHSKHLAVLRSVADCQPKDWLDRALLIQLMLASLASDDENAAVETILNQLLRERPSHWGGLGKYVIPVSVSSLSQALKDNRDAMQAAAFCTFKPHRASVYDSLAATDLAYAYQKSEFFIACVKVFKFPQLCPEALYDYDVPRLSGTATLAAPTIAADYSAMEARLMVNFYNKSTSNNTRSWRKMAKTSPRAHKPAAVSEFDAVVKIRRTYYAECSECKKETDLFKSREGLFEYLTHKACGVVKGKLVCAACRERARK